jgi:hypothetical protein
MRAVPPVAPADDLSRARGACALETRVAALDPDLVEASYEVDLGLLRWSLAMTPVERLRACTRSARALARLRSTARDPATTDRG